MQKIKRENLRSKMEKLQEEIKDAEKSGKVELLKQLLSQYQELAGGMTR